MENYHLYFNDLCFNMKEKTEGTSFYSLKKNIISKMIKREMFKLQFEFFSTVKLYCEIYLTKQSKWLNKLNI